MTMERTDVLGSSLNGRIKLTIAATVTVMAIYLGWFTYSPFVLDWNAPPAAVVQMASASWLFWFVLFAPLWLPLLMPSSNGRLQRVAQLTCGILLMLADAISWVWLLPGTSDYAIFVILTVIFIVGVFYIRNATRLR